jgi:hypothetical protein
VFKESRVLTRQTSLQIYVSQELAERVRAEARARQMSVSEWLRLLIDRTCSADEPDVARGRMLNRMARQSVFFMVGLDALLASHSDHALRERAHKAYARKCKELGLGAGSDEGGASEA